jgi:3-methyladenine DNA glycosylase AlkD
MKNTEPGQHIQEIKSHLRTFQGTIPLHRKESRRVYSFSSLSFTEQLRIWDELWQNEPGFYSRLHAYFFVERHATRPEELKALWPVVVRWQNQIDDWPLCDALSKIYTKILEIMPEEVYEQLKAWNSDGNPWKRRQSLVSLLYYSRTKKQYLKFNEIEPLITNLLTDKEYYVQKGLGWTLRELHNVYPTDTKQYLKQQIRSVSPIAFTIAIEKLDTTSINELKTLRKIKAV